MGLSRDSVGINAVDIGLVIKKINDTDKIVALGGNPNVGKSTVFNELTGLKQHTGNWPGKTVTNAQGYCTYKQNRYILVDLPGCYSLMAHSAEEEVARDFICFGQTDAVIIVCDASCLERNLNLVLQTLEITENVVVCVNLMDEAKKKRIKVDLDALSQKLGVPVIGTAARSKKGLDSLMQAVDKVIGSSEKQRPVKIQYPEYIEEAVSILEPYIEQSYDESCKNKINTRWLSLMLLNWDESAHEFIGRNIKENILSNEDICYVLKNLKEAFELRGITEAQIKDDIISALVRTAEGICKNSVTFENKDYKNKDVKIDKILSGKWTAFPIMILAILGIFWLTITGSNYPSKIIGDFLFWIEDRLLDFFIWTGTPKFIYEMLVLGVYRVLAWVVSVILHHQKNHTGEKAFI